MSDRLDRSSLGYDGVIYCLLSGRLVIPPVPPHLVQTRASTCLGKALDLFGSPFKWREF